MRKPGFTFLELLIALSIFTFGMVSVLQIFPINRRFLDQSSKTTQASYLAGEEMEVVRTVDYDTLTTGTYETRHAVGSSSTDPLNAFEREAVVSLIDGSYAATATDVGLKKVSVTVYWSERSVARQYSVVTYVHNQ